MQNTNTNTNPTNDRAKAAQIISNLKDSDKYVVIVAKYDNAAESNGLEAACVSVNNLDEREFGAVMGGAYRQTYGRDAGCKMAVAAVITATAIVYQDAEDRALNVLKETIDNLNAKSEAAEADE